jgi:micrococcal nuclease
VTYVSDGDTLFVRPASGGQPVKIRVDGLDAPEICQAYGPASRQALHNRLMGQTVRVNARHRDNFGRVLARIRWQQGDVGQWMVRQGHAWSYRYRRDAGPYAAEEAQAKAARLGLFADAGALQPRDFRKRHGSCQEPRTVKRR